MKRITILIEDVDYLPLMQAIKDAEEEGEFQFPFTIQTEESA